jgi:hypothetical protein
LETLADKKRFSKTMNTIIKDCAKQNGLEPKVIKAVKNYHHYKAVNWVDNNPLEKNKDSKEKDKVAPIFIKLLEVVENLRAVGDKDFLKPYIEALVNHGIKIEVDFKETDKNVEAIMDVVESASRLQTNVDTLANELKEVKSVESEELAFTPKNSFVNVLGILDKIREGKSQSDKIQDNFTNLTMLNNAFTYLSAKNEECESLED